MKIHFFRIFRISSYCIGFGMLVIFLLQYLFHGEIKNFPEGGDHVGIVLDVSKSMNVMDVNGQSRLSMAKQYIYSFMEQYNHLLISLTIFAGESQRVLPFTNDTELVATFLSGIDSKNITQQGTNISSALLSALESFTDGKTGTILLLTDGDEDEIEIPSAVIVEGKEKNISFIVVGIGSEQGGYIPTGDFFEPYEMYQGNPVVAKINVGGLKKLSEKLDGLYLDFPVIPDIQANIKNEDTYYSVNISVLIGSFFFWLLFFATYIIEIYFPKYLKYE